MSNKNQNENHLSSLDSEEKNHKLLCLNPFGFHSMHYTTYGHSKNPPLLMVHGLTRTGNDFNYLAKKLCDQYYVICPDIVGRGQSDWLPVGANYEYPQYLADLTALMARISAEYETDNEDEPYPEFTLLGTSMGGLLGMILASLSKTPIKKLIINDIGPFVSYDALRYIRNSLEAAPIFKDLDAGLNYLKERYVGYAESGHDEILKKASYVLKQKEDGTYTLHYDPRVMDFKIGDEDQKDQEKAADAANDALPKGVNFWPYWFAIQCPVFVIRGEVSTIFPKELCDAMVQTKPLTKTYLVANTGHAPALADEGSLKAIQDWLETVFF
jgi:pimeloyl-ACP methyl ester carboxylesterase